jgi:hypothetical protein
MIPGTPHRLSLESICMVPDTDPMIRQHAPANPPSVVATAARNAEPAPHSHPGPSDGTDSPRGTWVYGAGIFLLGVMCAEPTSRGTEGAAGVFGGGLGMLGVGFAVSSLFLGWRPSTRRMIPAGAFAVALAAFAAPRTTDTAARLSSFAEQASRPQTAEQIGALDLADEARARERVGGEWLRDFTRMFATEAEAPPAAPATPAPGAANALRRS